MRWRRHQPVREQGKWLGQVVRGLDEVKATTGVDIKAVTAEIPRTSHLPIGRLCRSSDAGRQPHKDDEGTTSSTTPWCILPECIQPRSSDQSPRGEQYVSRLSMPRRVQNAADRKARAIVDNLRAARMNTAADLVERSVSETLTRTT